MTRLLLNNNLHRFRLMASDPLHPPGGVTPCPADPRSILLLATGIAVVFCFVDYGDVLYV